MNFKFKKEDFWWGIRLLILVTILAGVFRFGYRIFLVDGASMDPSIDDKDVILVNKLSYDLQSPDRGDVIAFWHWGFGEFLVKRVVALPYEVIEIKRGIIYVNGREFIDEFNWEDLGFNVNEGPFTLGPQEYWVVGDNRDVSWWGIIYEDDIIGKVK